MPQEWKFVQVSQSAAVGDRHEESLFWFCFILCYFDARSRTRWRTLWKATVPVTSSAVLESNLPGRKANRRVATSEVGLKSD